MVGINMDGAARDRVLKLMEEKDRMESEIRDQNAVLEANHVGMHESLVDADGFPRNDIDVYKVRHARHRIICLQNDHKALMKRIEKGLAEVHANLIGTPVQPTGASSSNGHIGNGHIGNGHANNATDTREPFAVVTRVDDDSPADQAGLSANDKILQFGSLTHSNFDDMSQISHIVSHSVGQTISVQVRRDRHVVSVNLVPRPWAQPGLLGCHIQRYT